MRVADRASGGNPPVVTGGYLITCGFFRVGTPYPLIVLALLIGGFSRSVQFTAAQSLGYAEMPSELLSRATSFMAMAQQLAQSFGVGLVALVVHLGLAWHGAIQHLRGAIATRLVLSCRP